MSTSDKLHVHESEVCFCSCLTQGLISYLCTLCLLCVRRRFESKALSVVRPFPGEMVETWQMPLMHEAKTGPDVLSPNTHAYSLI